MIPVLALDGSDIKSAAFFFFVWLFTIALVKNLTKDNNDIEN
jgi:hypothetical protein